MSVSLLCTLHYGFRVAAGVTGKGKERNGRGYIM
jgi:hypothetical protein